MIKGYGKMIKVNDKTDKQRISELEFELNKVEGRLSVHRVRFKDLFTRIEELEDKCVDLEKKLAKKKNKKKKKKPEGWATEMTPEQMKEYEMWHRGYGEW